jgi:hypothetical protein
MNLIFPNGLNKVKCLLEPIQVEIFLLTVKHTI